MDVAYDSGWLYPRRPATHHVVVGAAAVALSLALHAFLLSRFPAVPVGRPAPYAIEEPLPPIVLQGVRLRPHARLVRPPAYRPENPGRAEAESPSAEAFREAVDPLALAPPALDEQLTGAAAPLASPSPAPERPAWQPRIERLEINRRVVPDEIAALPRRISASVPRAPQAPDVTLPVERPALEQPAAVLASLGAGAGAGQTPGAGLSPAAGRGGGEATGGPNTARTASRLIDETVTEVTGAKPLENELALHCATYRSPADPEYVYFAVRIERDSPGALPVLPQDVLLVQDCSESMTQAKLEQCKDGLRRYLQTLAPQDRFDVMGFRDTQVRCFNDWVPATAANRARASWFIEQMEARGRTDVYSGLKEILDVGGKDPRPVLAVVLSDGVPTMGMVNDSEILERFSEANRGRVSVFTFGGGPRINRFLLDFIAYKNRGETTVVTDRFAIPDAVAQLGHSLSRPVLTGLACRFSGVGDDDVFPRTLTNLYLDRPLVLYGRCRADLARAGVRIAGRAGAHPYDLVYAVDLANASPGEPAIRRQWAWQKAYYLIGEHIQTDDPAMLSRIRRLAVAYGISIPYAGELGVR